MKCLSALSSEPKNRKTPQNKGKPSQQLLGAACAPQRGGTPWPPTAIKSGSIPGKRRKMPGGIFGSVPWSPWSPLLLLKK